MILKRNSFEFFLMLGFLFISGQPLFSHESISDRYEILFLFILITYAFFKKLIIPTKHVKTLISVVFLVQSQNLDIIPFYTYSGVIVKFLIAFLMVALLKNFIATYINVMYQLVIISLFIFIVWEFFLLLGLDIKSLFLFTDYFTPVPGDINILIYNFSGKGIEHRNSGPFWEPGAFAGYIAIAIIFALLKYKESMKIFSKLNIALSLGLISTFSTMGFILLVFTQALRIRFSQFTPKGVIRNLFIISVIFGSASYVYSLSFVGVKISNQIEQADLRRNDWYLNRFGNIIFDYRYIKEKPFFGFGPHPNQRFSLDNDVVNRLGNGFTDTIVKYGGLFTIFIFIMIYRNMRGIKPDYSIRNNSILTSLIAVGGISLTLMSEQYLQYPLYWSLMYSMNVSDK